MNRVYGTVTAKVLYNDGEAQIGRRIWVDKERPEHEELMTALKPHLERYNMTLLKIVGWQVASDYNVA